MTEESKRHNSEYRNFFYAPIISENSYFIKYIKKNRSTGKQLEKVLKSIERQLLKLVLSHAQKFGDREHEASTYKKKTV
ncbi:hypothetical protein JavanS748_0006 [Streptococcus satellite phage Javan748]|nr:hypothetical protein JavanS748_0006 [Streptococcus satellite phage Javan748]